MFESCFFKNVYNVMQLIEAAKEGNLDVVKQLVSKGVKVECQDKVHIALLFSCLCARIFFLREIV